jgi:pyruvate/2-oxoglutarate dehydrogenase complex dihydrolipoamide acyltransferase (E2) component
MPQNIKTIALLIVAACIATPTHAEPPKKPAPAKPAAKPKKPAPAKPQKTIGELALDEAKKVDENHDGRITGPEVSKLKSIYAANPKSWLSIYDENSNRMLDDQEIEKLKWGPAAAPAKPAPAPAKKKPAPKKK